VKKLSFSFVDDTAQEEVDPNQTSIPMDEQNETQEKEAIMMLTTKKVTSVMTKSWSLMEIGKKKKKSKHSN